MSAPDGGPAFPRILLVASQGDERDKSAYYAESSDGMSLRDYFAGQALAAISGDGAEPETLAADAYRIADAMIAERAKATKR